MSKSISKLRNEIARDAGYKNRGDVFAAVAEAWRRGLPFGNALQYATETMRLATGMMPGERLVRNYFDELERALDDAIVRAWLEYRSAVAGWMKRHNLAPGQGMRKRVLRLRPEAPDFPDPVPHLRIPDEALA